ncbi:MAG TPA: hypothetical protein DCY95_16785 [Algoriphagus sp.]|nr:hypothetical protein [Algoriphagus sp.]MAN87754.1 hypothetical protein [Algoriphagus sp.]HAD50337.1 hypothetical protein [Algoriphagus sp.]HAH37220.1 hypothetical protein [Algoriphagus sp.]HAS58158.1 hypothetical protein [Algoriphagus sp.]
MKRQQTFQFSISLEISMFFKLKNLGKNKYANFSKIGTASPFQSQFVPSYYFTFLLISRS